MHSPPEIDPNTVAFLQAAGCVYPEEEARILTEAAQSADELRGLLTRRAQGEPLERIVGWAEYCNLRISVSPGVFVPRRRSEFLAECGIQFVRTLEQLADGTRRVKVLDMCCGSGAIGLAVALEFGSVELLACDESLAAVECARMNVERVGGRVYLGDLFEALPRAERHSVDLILANAPYVPTREMEHLPAEARVYEPVTALDGGPAGTSVQRRILESAAEWLTAQGCVMIETASGMATQTAVIAADAGFTAQVRRCPELDATVVIAARST